MDAVVFDMDGVLVNSEDYWIELERERVLPEVLPDDDVPVEELTGIFYEELYGLLEERYDVAVSYEEFVAIYECAADDIYGERVDLTPGLGELVAELRDRGVPVGMATASPPDWYETVLDRFDLPFDATLGVAEVDGPGKPDPAVYRAIAAELGVDPESMLVIEDSRHGTVAAARAGATVVAFGVGAAEPARENADMVAESPEEVTAIVRDRV